MVMATGRRVWFLCCLLVISLLLCGYGTNAAAEIKDPTGNLNLSPFQKWRSAYECLQNTSDSCPGKYTLNETGWMNLTSSDTESYCNGGCALHTKAVLTCIHLVHPDYKFINFANVQLLNDHISDGCTYGFNGTTFIPSNAKRTSKNEIIFVAVSILSALFLTLHFN